jgi:hypothetical protein
MTVSNSLAEFAAVFLQTSVAHAEREKAKVEFKALMSRTPRMRLAIEFEQGLQGLDDKLRFVATRLLGIPLDVSDAEGLAAAASLGALRADARL